MIRGARLDEAFSPGTHTLGALRHLVWSATVEVEDGYSEGDRSKSSKWLWVGSLSLIT